MKLILVNQRHGHTRTVILKGWMKGLLSICLLGAPVALGYLGYQLAISGTASFLTEDVARNWQQQLSLQEAELKQLRNDSKRELEALSLRLDSLRFWHHRLHHRLRRVQVHHLRVQAARTSRGLSRLPVRSRVQPVTTKSN